MDREEMVRRLEELEVKIMTDGMTTGIIDPQDLKEVQKIKSEL
jgi:hypothetical protein